jgi:hypothetical protein
MEVRAELAEGLQPRNGIERQLIDQLAQAQTGMYRWLWQLSGLEPSDTPWFEQAGAMADRFHRMFLRIVRMLASLRKVPLAVVVQNAGQVNVGRQQVNMAGAEVDLR